MINTYHAEKPGGYAQIDIDNLAAVIDAGPVTSMLADQSTYLDYVRTDVRGLAVANDITASNNANAGSGGTPQYALPKQVTFAVQRLSGLTGRSARGRVYIVGIPNGAHETLASGNNKITSVYANAYVGHVDGFRTAIEGIGLWNAVIVSRYTAGSKRATGVTFRWTSTQYNDLQLDILRQRQD